MDLEAMLSDLAALLPETSRGLGRRTLRDVCLTLHNNGTWSVMAGGHSAVHIGEYGGDFSGDGNTAEEAIVACRAQMRS